MSKRPQAFGWRSFTGTSGDFVVFDEIDLTGCDPAEPGAIDLALIRFPKLSLSEGSSESATSHVFMMTKLISKAL